MAFKQYEVEGIGTIKVYKRRGSRHLRLTVPSDGQIRVTTPVWVPYQAGLKFAESKREWIKKQVGSTPNNLLMAGQRIGKAQRLVFKSDHTVKAIKTRVMPAEVVVTHPAQLTPQDKSVQAAAETACIRALKGQAQKLLKQRLDQMAEVHNIGYGTFTVKRMKSRWGSCDQNKNIVLNVYLLQLPWQLIDYVIVHELTHTEIMRHGPDFWSRMEQLLPETKLLRKQMKTHRPILKLSEDKVVMS